eukprot:GHUV01007092.1.p1 GENE.GHUV01007092.1~~GHUV01007092.1.p1  ORF type:complete len:438 (+),score=119.18 GHUV01007092.1:227-1540(+)
MGSLSANRTCLHSHAHNRMAFGVNGRPRQRMFVVAAKSTSRTDSLRELLKGPTILKVPCCHDGLSARLIERAGFDVGFMSGFCTAGARLGAPDTGLISYGEMVDQGRNVHEATKQLPIIGDGDNGYGNAMNVKRTVRGYAAAGFAGILIEDQVSPKSCGHVRGKRVTSREEAVSRIRAAADARDEGADILIMARSDARQAESLDEALWRAAAFADAGADMLFIDALASEDEMRRFCSLGGTAGGLPKMANMLEGGGKTPILPPEALQDMGFKLVAYPLSLLGVSIRAMENALRGLKHGQIPDVRDLGTFVDIQMAVGFPEYYEEEARYAIKGGSSSSGSAGTKPFVSGFAAAAAAPAAAATAAATAAGSEPSARAAVSSSVGQQQSTVVEADEVVPPSSSSSYAVQQFGVDQSDRDSGWEAFRRSKFFRSDLEVSLL